MSAGQAAHTRPVRAATALVERERGAFTIGFLDIELGSSQGRVGAKSGKVGRADQSDGARISRK
jgi:hypothetical protein